MSISASQFAAASQPAIPEMIYDAVTSFPGAVCRKFEDITDTVCSPQVANVVKNAVYASPFTLASFFLPQPIKLAALIGFAIANILFKDLPSKQTKFNLFTGIGNAQIVRAVINTAGLVQTGNAVFALAAGIHLIFASLHHSIAKSYATPSARVE